jgi:GAF domain-containing protein
MRPLDEGYPLRVEPISETREAIEEFGPFAEDGDLLEELGKKGERVRSVVPDCVGFSLALEAYGVTFTLVASDEEVAVLDALQYIDGGPCVAAVEHRQALEYRPGHCLDEGEWQLFARGTAAAGVASTLSLPILLDGAVVGSVNLYAASGDAFTGRHGQLADIFDAWAPGAVANADLSFSSRRTAEQAPRILRDDVHIEIAAGVIAAREGLDRDTALGQLRAAARRAGVSEESLADAMVAIRRMYESE